MALGTRPGAGVLGRMQQSAGTLKREGVFRFFELAALSLSEPARSFGLRTTVAADAKDAIARIRRGERRRGLFIDCGSNVGQGYRFFSRYYAPVFFDYILVEPNKNCLPFLERVRADRGAEIEVVGKAAGVRNGYASLFGPPASKGELTYEGCSTVPAHNIALYEPEKADQVEVFSLAEMIAERQPAYDVVVLKMDVEGAEYEILPDLMERGVHRRLYAIYVEFHSIYMQRAERLQKRNVEGRIKHGLEEANVRFRSWI